LRTLVIVEKLRFLPSLFNAAIRVPLDHAVQLNSQRSSQFSREIGVGVLRRGWATACRFTTGVTIFLN
jgi:hypothetical protein